MRRRQELALRSLDGIRAMASIWVALFHVYVIYISNTDEKSWVQTEKTSWLVSFFINGLLGVDCFFVLSGVSAAFTLVPLLTDHSKSRKHIAKLVYQYWGRRLRRLMPIYLVGLFTSVLVAWHGRMSRGGPQLIYQNWFAGCPGLVPMNLLFINNRGVPTGCGVQYWSMAVTGQLYIILPLLLMLLRPRKAGFLHRFSGALSIAMAASLMHRYHKARSSALYFPLDFGITSERSMGRLVAWLHALYLPSFGRMLSLAIGASLGALLCLPVVKNQIKRSLTLKFAISGVAFTSLLAFLATIREPWHDVDGDPWPRGKTIRFAVLFHAGGIVPALSIATSILAMEMETDPLHAVAARVLNCPLFHHLAHLSLALYMFHAQCWYCLLDLLEAQEWWGKLVKNHSGLALAVACFGTLMGGYASAFLWKIMEKLWSNGKIEQDWVSEHSKSIRTKSVVE